jgi:hypothetical protein
MRSPLHYPTVIVPSVPSVLGVIIGSVRFRPDPAVFAPNR